MLGARDHFRALLAHRATRRVFWLLMLVCHAPAVAGVVRALQAGRPADPARLVLLGLSIGLFVLKAIDVPALRLRPSVRGLIAMTVIVALLHIGVLGLSPADNRSPQLLALLSGTLLLEPVQRRYDQFRALLNRLRQEASTRLPRPIHFGYATAIPFIPTLRLCLADPAAPPRAPPFVNC